MIFCVFKGCVYLDNKPRWFRLRSNVTPGDDSNAALAEQQRFKSNQIAPKKPLKKKANN
jgi:hypothetical protein